MSSRCHCRFSAHADTILGSHRDPIASEKCWLDFAVRELSRVAAGKARGQEAVWRSQCKPVWWDCACPQPWKNPTANPKDSKDTLKMKFECLVQHLRKEGGIPSDMEEEIERWEKGQVQELFLLTSFSCILGQTSNLHNLLDGTCRKMEDTGISVDPSILTDLEKCMLACVDKIKVMKKNISDINKDSRATPRETKLTGCSGLKRSHTESDADDRTPLSKCTKLSSSVSVQHFPLDIPSSSPSPSSPQSSSSTLPLSHYVAPVHVVSNSLSESGQQKQVDQAILQKLILQVSQKTKGPLPLKKDIVKSKPTTSSKLKRAMQEKKQLVSSEKGKTANRFVPPTSQPAPVSTRDIHENTDFGDFLSLDLGSNGDAGVNDLDFIDKLLEETSPDVSLASSPESTLVAETDNPLLPLHDALPTLKCLNQNPFQNCPLVIADRQINISAPVHMSLEKGADMLDSWEVDTVEEDVGEAFHLDAKDKLSDKVETITDSDYESSSPVSHRSSLDIDPYSGPSLCSPEDLEALLNSFQ